MILAEIEHYFQEPNLAELLSKYKDCFDSIDKFEEEFKCGVTLDIDKTMRILGGLFCSVNTVANLAKVYADDAKTSHINHLRSQYAKANEKIKITELKQQALEYAKNFSRIQAIFEAYRDNCDKLIFICQSSLKSEDREKRLSRG